MERGHSDAGRLPAWSGSECRGMGDWVEADEQGKDHGGFIY